MGGGRRRQRGDRFPTLLPRSSAPSTPLISSAASSEVEMRSRETVCWMTVSRHAVSTSSTAAHGERRRYSHASRWQIDDERRAFFGGATSTGVGEEVIRNVGSFLVVELMRQGYSPENACKEAVMRIIKKKPETAKNIQVGFLAINKQGEYGAYAIQKGFSFAVCYKNDQALLIKGNSYY